MNLEAKHVDSQKNLESEMKRYEQRLAADPRDGEAMRDLLVLCWQCTDFGFWSGNKLQRAFVAAAESRQEELVPLAHASGNPDCRFWAKYIQWVDCGEALDSDECMVLFEEGSLDAVLFPYSTSNGRQCADAAERLLDSVAGQRTVRERYILSVLEGVKHRR